MSRVVATLLACGLVLTAPLHAVDLDPSVCNAALGSIKNNFKLLSSSERFREYQSSLRNMHSETLSDFTSSLRSIHADIPYAKMVLGLNGSDAENERHFKARYDEFLSSTYEQSSAKEYFSVEREDVDRYLAGQWTECYRLMLAAMTGSGTVISASPAGSFSDFLIDVHTREAEAGKKPVIKAVEPAKLVTCFYNGAQIAAGMEIPDNDFNLVCSKDPSKELPLQITVSTGKSQQVTLPAQQAKLQELQAQLASALAQISQLRRDLTDATARQATTDGNLSADIAALKTWQTNEVGELFGPNYAKYAGQYAPSWKMSDVWAAAGDKESNVICPPSSPFMTGFKTFGNNFFVIRCRH